MSRSITEGAPSRLPVLMTTVPPTIETSTRPRRPVSACTLTRFSLQPWTVIPPPKLLTERLAPAGTANVVSVCLCDAPPSATSIAAASVATMSVILLGARRGHVVHTPQQFHLAPHCVGEVEVEVRVAGVAAQRHARLRDRPIDDGEILPHDANGRRIEPLLILIQRRLELGDRGVGGACPVTGLVDPRPIFWPLRHGRRAGCRPLNGEPHTASRNQHQGDAGREQLRDGQTETATDGAVTAVSRRACRSYRSSNTEPQILRGCSILERLRARD